MTPPLPVWIMMGLLGRHMGIHFLYHGQPMGFYDGWIAMIDAGLVLGLIYWAGLLDK